MRLISITEGPSRSGAKRLRVQVEGTLRECNGAEIAFAAQAASKHRRKYDLAEGRPNACRYTLATDMGSTIVRTTVSFPGRLILPPTTRRILRSAARAHRRLAPKGPPLVAADEDPGVLVARLIAAEIQQAGKTDSPWVASVSALQRRADMLRRVADRLIQDGLPQP